MPAVFWACGRHRNIYRIGVRTILRNPYGWDDLDSEPVAAPGVDGVGEDAGDEGIHRDAVDLAPLGEEPVQRLRDAEIDAVTLDPLQLVPPDIALTHEYS